MEKPQTFRSPTAVVVWVVWLLFAAGNWIDLAVQGRDHASVVAAAILLLATGAAYATAQRPRVVLDDAGVTIKNPIRDHRVAWAAITDADLVDLLRVHCTVGDRKKTISAWAVHYSRRRQLTADVKARRAAARTAGGGRPSMFGGFPAASRGLSYGTPAPTRDASDEATAKMIVRLIKEHATAAAPLAGITAPATTAPATAAAPAATAAAAPAATAAPASATADPSAAPAATAAAAAPASATADTSAAPAANPTRPLTSTWSATAIAALVIPALILLIVCLF